MADNMEPVHLRNKTTVSDFSTGFETNKNYEFDTANGSSVKARMPLQIDSQTPESGNLSLVEGSNLDMAVDALASLLKDFGHNAFDLPTVDAHTLAARCDAWVKHVLFASVPPGDTIVSEALAGGKRDWNALRLFFHQHRHLEKEYVQNSLNDLRDVIWTCVRELDQALQGEAHTDNRLRNQMERLQMVVQSKDLEEIKQAVLSTVTTMNLIMEQQREQQKMRMEALHSRIRELDFLLAQARKENSLDPLTNLFNRKAFSEQIATTLNLVSVFEEKACLFLVDADHFKAVNDTYGHPAGDTTLRTLADCFSRHFSGRNDCVARYGGEEFVIICQEMPLAVAQRQAERLLDVVRNLTIRHPGLDVDIHLTISIGLAEARACDNVNTWIDRADKALYRAKQSGRDRIEIN